MAARRRVLILAGSTEASALARRLGGDDRYAVTLSYAGRTRSRTPLPGRVRVGGFGGVDGLVRYLQSERVESLLDATHPFAAQMPHHAAQACETTGVARLRLCRPPWVAGDGDDWRVVDDLDGAASALEALGARRVLLTTGRQQLEPFVRVRDVWFLVRAIEEPASLPLPAASVLLARGPFDEASELALLREQRIDAVVSKNSGGAAAAPKLAAARTLRLPVVMVRRPPGPAGPCVADVDDALSWLAGSGGVAPPRAQAG